jgi:hypothetical protein
MSLGGFAAGLAGAFQKAEDRYQERKLRQQASAEAKLRQAAGFAFREKMYTRQMRDAYNDELTKTRNYLTTVFGDTDLGRQYVSALLPFGESAIEIVKDHRQQAQDRGVDLKSFMQVAHPNGLDKNTYKAPDLDNVVSYLSKKKFGEDIGAFDFKLPTVEFKQIAKPTDYLGKYTGSTAEGTLQRVTNGILEIERNIDRGLERDPTGTLYTDILADLKSLRTSSLAQIESEGGTGSLGSPEVSPSLTRAVNLDVIQKVQNNIQGEIVTFKGEEMFEIDYEGNSKLAVDGALRILSTLPSAFKIYDPQKGVRGALQTFGSKNAYASGYYQNLFLPMNDAIEKAKRTAQEDDEVIDLTMYGDIFNKDNILDQNQRSAIVTKIGYTAGDTQLKVAKFIKNGKPVIAPVGEFDAAKEDANPNGFFVYAPLKFETYQRYVGVNY